METNDYISRESLIEQIDNLCSDNNENWIGDDNHSFILHADVIDIIGNEPAIDVAPVVHAHWRYNTFMWENDWHCSHCDGWVENPTKYCPHCGAMIDERGK